MRNEFETAGMDDCLAPLLAESPAVLASADVHRQREILDKISDICRSRGARASAAVPLLITWPISADRNTEDSVCYALAYCAPASIAPLVELADNQSDPLRARACRSFGLMGSELGNHRVAVSNCLLRRLKDLSQPVRKEAAFALGLVRDGRQLVIEELAFLVREGSNTDRAAALHALGNLGRAARDREARNEVPIASCADLVIDALIDPDGSDARGLRIWVAIALAEIASDPETVPVLIAALEDDEMVEIWDVACNALASIGSAALSARDLLIDLCSVPVDEIRDAAKRAVAAIDRKHS